MVAAIKHRVTVQPGGLIEVRLPQFQPGQLADVIVLIETPNPTQMADPAGESPLARLQRFVGAVDSGDPRSSDNERIDADLARAYGATNDPGT